MLTTDDLEFEAACFDYGACQDGLQEHQAHGSLQPLWRACCGRHTVHREEVMATKVTPTGTARPHWEAIDTHLESPRVLPDRPPSFFEMVGERLFTRLRAHERRGRGVVRQHVTDDNAASAGVREVRYR